MEKKDYTCAECAADFKSQAELDNHNRTMHQKQTGSQPQGQRPDQKRSA